MAKTEREIRKRENLLPVEGSKPIVRLGYFAGSIDTTDKTSNGTSGNRSDSITAPLEFFNGSDMRQSACASAGKDKCYIFLHKAKRVCITE